MDNNVVIIKNKGLSQNSVGKLGSFIVETIERSLESLSLPTFKFVKSPLLFERSKFRGIRI